MANINYSNTVDLLKAASPHVDVATKPSLELVAKLFDLMGTLQSIKEPSNVAALGVNHQTFNLENLLSSIRPFTSEKERGFVDRILNMFNIKKMLEMYQQYSDIFKTMQGFSGFNSNQDDNNNQDNSDEDEREPFDIDAFFKQFQSNNTDDEIDDSSHFEFDYTGEDIAFEDDGTYDPNNLDFNFSYDSSTNDNYSDDSTSYNSSNDNSFNDKPDNFSEDDNPDYLQDFVNQLKQMQHNDKKTDDTNETVKQGFSSQINRAAESINGNTKSNTNQSNNQNANPAAMLDMMKNMVSPEQMSNLQNLSMLFNTMSYTDTNNKKKDNGGV